VKNKLIPDLYKAKNHFFLVALFSCLVYSFDFAAGPGIQIRGDHKTGEKLNIHGFKNLYKINENLYRSDQPHKKGMYELQNLGIHTILDLRNLQNDQKEACKTKLILKRVPIKAGKISYTDILESLKIIDHSEKPVLVHCLHGSDRTGCIIAAYRMVYNNWSKDEAIAEFTDKVYGYHKKLYPNILNLLRFLDIESLKKDLDIGNPGL
jgi:protein tyrosine/serine phosphatase